MAVLNKSKHNALHDLASYFGFDDSDKKTPYDSISARPVPSPGPPPIPYGPPPPPDDSQPVPSPESPPFPYNSDDDDQSEPTPMPGPPPVAGRRPQSVSLTRYSFPEMDLSRTPSPSPTPAPMHDDSNYTNLQDSGKLGPVTNARAAMIQAIEAKKKPRIPVPPPRPMPTPGPPPVSHAPFGPVFGTEEEEYPPPPPPAPFSRFPTATPVPTPMGPPLPKPVFTAPPPRNIPPAPQRPSPQEHQAPPPAESPPMPPSSPPVQSTPYQGEQLPPFEDLDDQRRAMMGANAIGNYALAGASIARGALPPMDGMAVGNSINKQNAALLNDFQQSNSRRLGVMQMIAAQRNAANIASGKNQTALNIANTRAATPKGNPNAQSNFERSIALRQQGLDSRNEQNANQTFNAQTAPYTQSIDSGNRLQHVLDAVSSGQLISSANVKASMENDISQILSNSKNTTVSDKDHAAIQSLTGTYNQIASFAQSKPKDTIPKEYLDQFQKELNILKNSNITNYRNKMNELKSGTTNPTKQNVYQSRFDSQVKAQTPDEAKAENSGFPKEVRKSDGTKAIVNNQQEADEAKAEGFQ